MKQLNQYIETEKNKAVPTGKHIVEIRDEKSGRIIRRRCIHYNAEPSMTEQQFAIDGDANNIVKKYGYQNLPHPQGLYADFSNIPDLSTAMETVAKAQQSFEGLPSEIREKFSNSPDVMVKWLQDIKNRDEAIELGLVNPPQKDPEPTKVFITNEQKLASAAT